jgi:hypothetical protein
MGRRARFRGSFYYSKRRKNNTRRMGFAEWGEEVEVGRYSISECIEDGGREEPNIPKFKAGKWYIGIDENEEHDSLDEAKARCKVLEEEWEKRRIVLFNIF